MAHLKQRGNTYYVRYKDPKTRKMCTKALNTDSRQIAELKLVEFYNQTAISSTPATTATRTPLSQAVQKFTESIDLHKDTTNACKCRSVLRTIFGPICKGLEYEHAGNERYYDPDRPVLEADCLEDLTTARISDYLDSVLIRTDKKGIVRGYVGKKTRNRYREALHFLYEQSLTPGRCHMPGGNPVTKIPYLKEDKPNIRYLTREAISKQLDCLADHTMLQSMVATYIFAGLRREEALWLFAEDIDLKNGTIKVYEKTINGEHWRPKNGEDRIVPISDRVRTYLEHYLATPSSSEWLFPNPAGRRWHPDVFADHLRATNLEVLQLPEMKDNPFLKMAVSLYLYTSMDWEHIFALTNKDIDLDGRIILVRRKKVFRLAINEKLMPVISAYKTVGGCDDPFLPTNNGGIWDVNDFRSLLQSYLRKKNLDWSCDEYRHTFGSHLAQNGISTLKIAKFMGNSEAIVIKHYAKLLPVDCRDNLEF